MNPGRVNLQVWIGKTWNTSITWYDNNDTPVDLTGYVGRMQVRKSVTSDDVVIELTTENDRISVDALGTIVLTLTAIDTQTLEAGTYVYDLEVEKDSVVSGIIEGKLRVFAEVTR